MGKVVCYVFYEIWIFTLMAWLVLLPLKLGHSVNKAPHRSTTTVMHCDKAPGLAITN